jgi:hypothetical protein
MERLWSPVVATGGNQWQIGSARKPQKQASGGDGRARTPARRGLAVCASRDLCVPETRFDWKV